MDVAVRGIRDRRQVLTSRGICVADRDLALAILREAGAGDVKMRGQEQDVARGIVARLQTASQLPLDGGHPIGVIGHPLCGIVLQTIDETVLVDEGNWRQTHHLISKELDFNYPSFGWR